MTRKATPAESIKGYLQQLTPQTHARLLAEIERLRQNGNSVPGADIIVSILAELRADSRPDARPLERLDHAARHFFRPLEPFLADRPPEQTNGGQIARASLPTIWEWIGRDLMASMTRDYAGAMKQFIATGKQREAEQAAQSFQTKAVKYLEGTLASDHGAAQARAQLADHSGSSATFDELAKMLRALKARDGLAQFAQALPARIDKLIGARLDATHAALDTFAAAHPDAVPFGLALVAQHLKAPWQLMRLATKAVDTKTAAEIAATPYAVAITMVLDQLDDRVDGLRAALRSRHVPQAKEILADIYDTEHAMRVRIDLADSAWGRRLDATMAMVSEAIESELRNFPAGLHHVLRSRGLKPYESFMGEVVRLGWRCHDVLAGGVHYGRHLIAGVRKSHAWSIFQ